MTLQQKIMNAFIGKVVRKDLAFQVKGGLPVPTYVLEYLLGQYCATDDQEAIEAGLVAYSHGEYFELGEKIGKFGYSVKK